MDSTVLQLGSRLSCKTPPHSTRAKYQTCDLPEERESKRRQIKNKTQKEEQKCGKKRKRKKETRRQPENREIKPKKKENRKKKETQRNKTNEDKKKETKKERKGRKEKPALDDKQVGARHGPVCIDRRKR